MGLSLEPTWLQAECAAIEWLDGQQIEVVEVQTTPPVVVYQVEGNYATVRMCRSLKGHDPLTFKKLQPRSLIVRQAWSYENTVSVLHRNQSCSTLNC